MTFVSEPIPLPSSDFYRADLEFLGVDHSTSSFEARVFFDSPDADESTPLEDDGYAGSFHIFGHGGCYGDEGHCDITESPTPFDQRMPHQLTPAAKTVIVTDALRRVRARGVDSVTVTIVPIERPTASVGERHGPTLQFEQLSLITYD